MRALGRLLLLPLVLVVGALVVAGCGDERTSGEVSGGGGGGGGAGVEALVAAVGDDVEVAPKVIAAEGEPPAELVKHDLVTGTGTEAKVGDTVRVRYTLVAWGSTDVIDSSWTAGAADGGLPQPVAFPLQEGGLIDGWIKGIPGMRPGGRRVLVVPPDLGYGSGGSGPVPPNATLVFVVDLVGTGDAAGR
ncbi:MAG: FKBP-type peptidyl-prolyl cis-trans isomerase [Solirubrobacteraceae bacterium]|nr:FKBP-type peptidyl-prolyl cis-trans isomerase [Solirubrobacteraceae bacterium]